MCTYTCYLVQVDSVYVYVHMLDECMCVYTDMYPDMICMYIHMYLV